MSAAICCWCSAPLVKIANRQKKWCSRRCEGRAWRAANPEKAKVAARKSRRVVRDIDRYANNIAEWVEEHGG